MAIPQTPGQMIDSKDVDLPTVLKIVGLVLLFLIFLVVLRFLMNMFIDLAILRDADSMMRALSQIRRFFCPCWHPRTQNVNSSQEPNESRANNRQSVDTPGQRTIISLLGGLTSEQRQTIVSAVIKTEVASKDDLQVWLKQDNQRSPLPVKGRDLEYQSESSDGSIASQISGALLCPICIHDIEVGDSIVNLSSTCKHRFHSACLIQWLSTQTRDCPYCRAEILTQDMIDRAHDHRREVLQNMRHQMTSISIGSDETISDREQDADLDLEEGIDGESST